MTSSIDFLPKFGIALSSPSDFEMRSPTVWMPARLRQLYERTPSSSSSMRMSCIGPAWPPPPPPLTCARPSPSIWPAAPVRMSSMRSGSLKIASCWMRISAASRIAACGSTAPAGSRVRRGGAVGLDVEGGLVVVGALADARRLDRVRDAAHGREDRVDRDDADGLVGRLVVLGGAVAAAAADREVQLELRPLVERGDVDVRVEDLDARGQIDVLGGDVTGARDDQRRLDLGRVGVHAADDALEVEDDVGHVLGHTLDRGELVRDALDADAGHGGAGQRAEAHAAQGGAEGVAEAAVERLDRERAAIVLHVFGGDSGDLEVEHRRGPDCRVTSAARRRGRSAARSGVSWLLGVQLDDELLLHGRRDLATLGLAQHLGGERVMVCLQPGRNRGRQLRRIADELHGAGLGLDGDHVAVAHLIAGDVHPPAVDRPVAVADELPRLPARRREAEADEHVVEAALEERQQVLAGDAGLPGRLLVVVAELLLEHAVVASRLLLLAKLHAVLRLLLPPATVVARRVRAPLDAALVGQAALALEEQLLPLAAALLALRTGLSSHARPLRPGAACGGGSRCALAGSRP